jgi:ABC-2 type transport system permease protein
MRMGDTSSLAGENGCLRGVLQMVVLAVVAILLVPVALALLLPDILSQHSWYLFLVPAVLFYGIAFYQIATRIIARVLLGRTPEILGVTVRET